MRSLRCIACFCSRWLVRAWASSLRIGKSSTAPGQCWIFGMPASPSGPGIGSPCWRAALDLASACLGPPAGDQPSWWDIGCSATGQLRCPETGASEVLASPNPANNRRRDSPAIRHAGQALGDEPVGDLVPALPTRATHAGQGRHTHAGHPLHLGRSRSGCPYGASLPQPEASRLISHRVGSRWLATARLSCARPSDNALRRRPGRVEIRACRSAFTRDLG